ncbi:NAD(P)-binding domain-containing protein [Marinobacterium jannaschii]|uniref:NAD(P)-binding domain-containing protein n=1 Tax=Marinobacterium jannaschii TaxID=64970 RepID=UPI0004817ECD|nr:NAD(P)-binding domain-containing protein [Marinobacterium jannaschii]
MKDQSVGFIGTGHLASYVIRGLRNAGDNRTINVSPRNAQTAETLKLSANCNIAESNQQLIDSSDVIILSLRPDQVGNVLTDCTFKPGQLLISCVAGISSDTLSALAPNTRIVRAMPVSSVEFGEGATPLYPAHEFSRTLFGQISTPVELENERGFEIALTAACANGWFYQLFEQLEQWMVNEDIDARAARCLMLNAAKSAAVYGLRQQDQPLGEILEGIATEGTYTKLGLEQLKQQDAFSAWDEACDSVKEKLFP